MKGDGTGSFSIYGDKFPVRLFTDQLTSLLSTCRMRTSKRSTQSLVSCPWLAQVLTLSLRALTLTPADLVGKLRSQHEWLPGRPSCRFL